MNQPGTYNASLQKGKLGKAGTGSSQVVLTFNVTHYQSGSEWVDIEPFDRNVFLSLAGKAVDYTQKKLAALGYTEPKVEKDPQTGEHMLVFPEAISDESVALTCKHADRQGVTKEDWDIANWGGGSTGEDATDEDVLEFTALW
jgi:hypothetical protein